MTTGFQEADKIIEIGLVVFEYDPETGQAFRVLDSYGCLDVASRVIISRFVAGHSFEQEK